ncbi:MAG: hypothetical protein RQ783_10075 [Gammaproteobacteria bacterium]|nr:hypothetical protein [Gammaproteobacteria bacterium]
MNKTLPLYLQFLTLVSLLWLNVPIAGANDPINIFKNGKFYGDLRYRYEQVDQDGFSKDATASTFRSRLGLVTGEYKNFQASVELDSIGTIGTSRFNSTINGKSQFPVVADPVTSELNALWLAWNGMLDTNVKLGRQPINLDNQRFIGTVGFRQNDQTYDAVTVNNRSIKNLHLFYSFTDQVNRVFGHKNPAGELNADIHMGRAEYEFLPNQKIIAYTYWLDFNRLLATSPSSKTYGLRIIGNAPVSNEISVLYLAEGARQHDLGNAVNNFSVSYYHVLPGIAWKYFTLEAGIESLGSNGTSSFSTPLATLHAHNGWADKFLVTPIDGLQDRYLKATYRASGINKWIDGTLVQLFYHDFNSVKGTENYGTEWNFDITRVFTEKEMMPLPYMKQWSFGVRYADYSAQDFDVDTRKGWITLGARF